MTYAVIRTGGKQYRVAVGDVIRVERLSVEPGKSIKLNEVLLVGEGDEVRVGTPALTEAVTVTVRSHGRGNKVRIFKMRRRKTYRHHAGHRQAYTELEVTGIDGAAKKASAKKASAKAAQPKTSDRVKAKADEIEQD